MAAAGPVRVGRVMGAVLIPLLVVASLAAYFWIGWRQAVAGLPAAWDGARRAWDLDSNQRIFVRGRMITTTLFWPLMLTGRAAIRKLDAIADAADPAALAARVREQDTRIAQLERELGIGQAASWSTEP
jgi:hypothetical protein